MDSKTLVLDNKTYSVQTLPAKRGARLFVKTMRLIGPGLSTLLDPALSKEDLTGEKFATSIGKVFMAADSGPFDEVLTELMDTVEENGRPIKDTWNLQFAGNVFKLFQIAGFAIGAHFGDFQKGFAGLTSSAPVKPSTSSETMKKA